MQKIRWILLLGSLIVGGGIWSFFERQGKLADQPTSKSHTQRAEGRQRHSRDQMESTRSVPVVAGIVEEKDVPIYLDGIGTVQAFNSVTVRNQVDGQIVKIGFEEGQEVKAGDVLAAIDPRPYQATLDQAIAKKAQDVAQLNNARVEFQRNAKLLQKKVLDQQAYDTSKYLVDQMAAMVKTDDAVIESAQVQLDHTVITSPIDGKVGIRQVDIGNFVQVSNTTGIVLITQMKPISVLFTLPQQQLNQVNEKAAKGTLKVLAVDRDNTKVLSEGTLGVVDNQIDPTTGTVKLKATFANIDLKLWPGQFINARLLLTMRKGALVVPAAVVQRGPQGTFAYVIKEDETAEMRTVKVSQIEDGSALIDDGLQAGERVVVDGQYKLQAGAQVNVVNPSPQPGKTLGGNS